MISEDMNEKSLVDLLFERLTDNITVGDPKEMIDHDFENDPYLKARLEEMVEFLRKHPFPEEYKEGRNLDFD